MTSTLIDLDALAGLEPNAPRGEPADTSSTTSESPCATPSRRPKLPTFPALCIVCGTVQDVSRYDAHPLDVYDRHRYLHRGPEDAWPCVVRRKCRAHGEEARFLFNDRQVHWDYLAASARAEEYVRERLAEVANRERKAAWTAITDAGGRFFNPKDESAVEDRPGLMVTWTPDQAVNIIIYRKAGAGLTVTKEAELLREILPRVREPEHAKWFILSGAEDRCGIFISPKRSR